MILDDPGRPEARALGETRRRGEPWWRAASKEAGRARAREVRAELEWERAGRLGRSGAARRGRSTAARLAAAASSGGGSSG